MKTLSIDIETYSDVPLQKTGAYRYVESPDFQILLFAYSVDSQSVQVINWSYVKNNGTVKKKLKVAAYCRVLTESDAQLKSLEAQKNHYERYIDSREDWQFAGLNFD